MLSSITISNDSYSTAPFADAAALRDFYEAGGCDGVELILCGDDFSKFEPGMVNGLHLPFYPEWISFWRGETDYLRKEFGNELHLLHDVHHRLTPIEAARLGKSVEDYRLFWMEDPTPAENQEAFRLIRQHTVTPIAVGEVMNTIWDCKDLIEEQLIDYIRMTMTHAGGITHMRRIADLAALYQVRTGSHGPSDLSPVCMGAALHFDLSIPNFGMQEYMGYHEQTMEVFQCAWSFDDGFMHPGEKPGLGVEIDEALAAKYPYEPAYLPVARLEDGTLWNW